MTVTLTDEQYGALWHAVTKIARGYEPTHGGGVRRMSKENAVLEAREACDVLGWSYSGVELRPDRRHHRVTEESRAAG